MRVTYLTLTDFEVICHELLHFFKSNKEPHPTFSESYFDKLDSVIDTPRRTFGKKDLYPNLIAKASCYFYFVNKLHPFSNGNKRLSIVSTGVFLMANGYEFTASEDMMYDFAKKVTLSKRNQKVEFKEVIEFIEKNSRRQRGFSGPQFIIDLLKLLEKRLPGK